MTRREREVTDLNIVKGFLDKGKVVHLGLCDGDQPYVVPMNYGYTLENGKLTLYLHGATTGYKYDVIARNPKVSFSIECDVQGFQGKVACQYGTAYSSVFGKGIIRMLEDVSEKEEALRLFMKTQTGLDFAFHEKLVSVVNVMRVDVDTYTAKQRPLPASPKE